MSLKIFNNLFARMTSPQSANTFELFVHFHPVPVASEFELWNIGSILLPGNPFWRWRLSTVSLYWLV